MYVSDAEPFDNIEKIFINSDNKATIIYTNGDVDEIGPYKTLSTVKVQLRKKIWNLETSMKRLKWEKF